MSFVETLSAYVFRHCVFADGQQKGAYICNADIVIFSKLYPSHSFYQAMSLPKRLCGMTWRRLWSTTADQEMSLSMSLAFRCLAGQFERGPTPAQMLATPSV